MNLPWREIRDFLLEAECATSSEDLCLRAARGLERLIPYDAASLVIGPPDGKRFERMECIGVEQRNIDAYLGYYHRLDPFKYKLMAAGQVTWIDLHPYKDTEFVTDFMAPQRIRFSLGLLLRDRYGPRAAAITLARCGKRGFTEREQAMAEIVQVNLNTMMTLIYKLTQADGAVFHPAELAGGRLLSKREAEVAALLCRRLTANEIAIRLMISPLTARKHIENIHAKLGVKSRLELVGRLMGRSGCHEE